MKSPGFATGAAPPSASSSGVARAGLADHRRRIRGGLRGGCGGSRLGGGRGRDRGRGRRRGRGGWGWGCRDGGGGRSRSGSGSGSGSSGRRGGRRVGRRRGVGRVGVLGRVGALRRVGVLRRVRVRVARRRRSGHGGRWRGRRSDDHARGRGRRSRGSSRGGRRRRGRRGVGRVTHAWPAHVVVPRRDGRGVVELIITAGRAQQARERDGEQELTVWFSHGCLPLP